MKPPCGAGRYVGTNALARPTGAQRPSWQMLTLPLPHLSDSKSVDAGNHRPLPLLTGVDSTEILARSVFPRTSFPYRPPKGSLGDLLRATAQYWPNRPSFKPQKSTFIRVICGKKELKEYLPNRIPQQSAPSVWSEWKRT